MNQHEDEIFIASTEDGMVAELFSIGDLSSESLPVHAPSSSIATYEKQSLERKRYSK